ncbi:MAG: energy transducer TonB, partial [Sphingomonadales bacterium]|nr:energy transducer TonB [Sphingomonadales bacterium]
CVVVESSGNADLDSATCRMIRQRFRYAPARNAAGEPVADRRGWRQSWCLGRSDCPVG